MRTNSVIVACSAMTCLQPWDLPVVPPPPRLRPPASKGMQSAKMLRSLATTQFGPATVRAKGQDRAGSLVTYLPFQVGSFIRRGSRQDAGVAEAGPKQGPHDKEEQDSTHRRDGWCDIQCEVWAAASRGKRVKTRKSVTARKLAASHLKPGTHLPLISTENAPMSNLYSRGGWTTDLSLQVTAHTPTPKLDETLAGEWQILLGHSRHGFQVGPARGEDNHLLCLHSMSQLRRNGKATPTHSPAKKSWTTLLINMIEFRLQKRRDPPQSQTP